MALLSTGVTTTVNAIEPRYSHTIELVQNDTRPQLNITIIDDMTQLAMDLTGVSAIKLHLREEDADVIKTSIPMYVAGDPVDGQVFMQWTAGALDTAGWFVGEIELTFGTGESTAIQTLYEEIRFKIRADYKTS